MNNTMLGTLPWDETLLSEQAPFALPEESKPEKLDGNQLKLLSSVRVELSVEIGRLSLSLGDLLDLSSGTKLELELPEALPVTLRVDAVPVAVGRIVYDGEEPTVEITEVSPTA